MTDKINDGGPAFPLENPRLLENGELFKQFYGLSMRDYFAGQAISGMSSSPYWDGTSFDAMATAAYSYADAMINAREFSNG